MSDLVQWSVNECNRLYGNIHQSIDRPCPKCGKDSWRTYFGISPVYRSEYNPGEYIQRTCAGCGFVGPEEPC